ncbi:MAG: ribosome biogenesis GTPase Der, partial [Verrucomicrobia bacterium 21-51-4]
PKMTPEAIHEATELQVDIAIETATVIVFLCDVQEGYTAIDAEIANKLRRLNKKVILAVNKVDLPVHEARLVEFKKVGLGHPIAISAEHGRGVDELKEYVEKILGPAPEVDTQIDHRRRLRVALVGRPNVGKSSLGNILLKSERLIVSPISGTTREAVETPFDFTFADGKEVPFSLVDTAGLRGRRKVSEALEYFTAVRSNEALQSVDVVVQVLDAMDGVTVQDKYLAGEVLAAGKPLVIVVNKWDYATKTFAHEPLKGYENESEFRDAFAKAVRENMFFLPRSPILFVSALKNTGIDQILWAVREVDAQAARELKTGELNRVLEKLFARKEPRSEQGRRFRIYYAVQTGSRPIRIRLYCNKKERLDPPYARYLVDGIRSKFNLEGCPVIFEMRDKEEPSLRQKPKGGKGSKEIATVSHKPAVKIMDHASLFAGFRKPKKAFVEEPIEAEPQPLTPAVVRPPFKRKRPVKTKRLYSRPARTRK